MVDKVKAYQRAYRDAGYTGDFGGGMATAWKNQQGEDVRNQIETLKDQYFTAGIPQGTQTYGVDPSQYERTLNSNWGRALAKTMGYEGGDIGDWQSSLEPGMKSHFGSLVGSLASAKPSQRNTMLNIAGDLYGAGEFGAALDRNDYLAGDYLTDYMGQFTDGADGYWNDKLGTDYAGYRDTPEYNKFNAVRTGTKYLNPSSGPVGSAINFFTKNPAGQAILAAGTFGVGQALAGAGAAGAGASGAAGGAAGGAGAAGAAGKTFLDIGSLSAAGTAASPGIASGGIWGAGTGAAGTSAATGAGAAGGIGSTISKALTGGGVLGDIGRSVVGSGIRGLLSGAASAYSDKRAYDAQEDIERQLLEAQGKAQEVIQPYADLGTEATQQIREQTNAMPNYSSRIAQEIDSGDLGGTFEMQDFREDPGYQFRLEQGNQALQRKLGAMGMSQSGRAIKEAMRLNQGLADQTFNDSYNRWMGQQQNRYNVLSGQQGRQLNTLGGQQAIGATAAGGLADIFANRGNISAETTANKSNVLSRALSNLFRPSDDYYYG